jgi:hypothetical protein
MTEDRLGDDSPESRKAVASREAEAIAQSAATQSRCAIEWTVAPVRSGWIARIQITMMLSGPDRPRIKR